MNTIEITIPTLEQFMSVNISDLTTTIPMDVQIIKHDVSVDITASETSIGENKTKSVKEK